MSVLTSKIQRAINFAGKAHGTQLRKGVPIPYIVHPMSVALLLSSYGYSEQVIVAGILHDVLEDTDVTLSEFTAEWQYPITDYVKNVSEEDKTLDWDVRKRKAMKKVKIMQAEALAIKAADAIANMRDMIVGYEEEGDTFFEKFKKGKGDQLARYSALSHLILNRSQQFEISGALSTDQFGLYKELEYTLTLLLECF